MCLGILLTVLLVQPYKNPYALYNNLDAVMTIQGIVFITCILQLLLSLMKKKQNVITGIAGVVAMHLLSISSLKSYSY